MGLQRVASDEARPYARLVEDELDRVIARMEREVAARDAARAALIVAARELPSARLAGIWREEETIVVAVTRARAETERRLRAASGAALRVTQVEHALATLEAICDAIVREADVLGVPAGVGVDVAANRAVVTLERLDLPGSRALRERFVDQPVTWEEGIAEPARSAGVVR